MDEEVPVRRVLLTHAPPEAFADVSRAILGRLGYALLTPEEFAASRQSLGRDLPDLRIIDERSLGELPEDGSAAVPLVVLTGRHGVTGADPRIAGAIRRPAGLHELYRIVQEILEDTPRSTPRIATHLNARCSSRGKEWIGVVLSLSESGCLLRSSEPQMLGASLNLSFHLPRTGRLSLDAEVSYQLLPDLGLTFHATSPADRRTIAAFVARALEA